MSSKAIGGIVGGILGAIIVICIVSIVLWLRQGSTAYKTPSAITAASEQNGGIEKEDRSGNLGFPDTEVGGRLRHLDDSIEDGGRVMSV